MRKKKNKGRPPKYPGERLSQTRSFRIRKKIDKILVTSAHKNDRTISQEIENRIERSFDDGDILQRIDALFKAFLR